MSWILVMYIYAGVWAKGDSVAMNTIEGFSSIATCQAAGEKFKPLVNSTSKESRFVCLEKK